MNVAPAPTPAELARRFPKSFRFGVADSDLQVIGEDACLREEQSQPTMWGWFATQSGKVHGQASPGPGVDRYHRWEEDADLIAALGFRHYRTSISWARLMREDNSVNRAARDWYVRYFRALRERGIRVYATLYHWELPLRYSLVGGWKNRATVDDFVLHARASVEELGEYVDEFFILNEPWCSAHNSFYTGTHAPGEANLRNALIAAHHLLLAQARAFEAIREIAPAAPVGTVINYEPAFPRSETPEDLRAAQLAHEFFNGWFLDPLFLGHYPEAISRVYADSMPQFSQADLDAIRIGPQLHALGINYYLGKVIADTPESPLLYEPVRLPGESQNALGWSVCVPPVYPEGLRLGLRQIHETYGPHGLPPLAITENGYAGEDAGRVAYFGEHLRQLAAALDDGLRVSAYFAWTLMDNYEWAEGYREESRFGLVGVDREDMTRAPKPSAHWFRDLLAAHGSSRPA
ncbi:glycoside hydrolase family 1 protein [Haloferula sargassicola]|uniref:Beta-glucosidase A n=1 Tax=Haloferula sargassicola TaxID=490096 RepID=A0ABP9UP71_9BACT